MLERRKRIRLRMRSISQTHLRPRLAQMLMLSAFNCKGKGQWKRNYKLYLASLKKDSGGKGTPAAHALVYVTDIFLANSYINSWVFDTGSVAHICNTVQRMIRSRSIKKGEVDFAMGNNSRVAVLNVGTMQLHLPSRFILELNNCYFVCSLSRNIVVTFMFDEGWLFICK